MATKSYEAAIVQPQEPKKTYDQAVVSPAGNKFGEQIDPQVAADMVNDMGVSALQGGTANFADDAAGLVNEELGQSIRDAHAKAQERNPVASFVAETAAEQVNPLLKANSLRKNILTTMAKILGSSEDKMSLETAGSMAAGAGVDTAVDILLKNMKIPFSNAPKTLRARVAGAGTTEFKDIGINDREKIAERVHEMNFFSGKPTEFDMNTLKFVPKKTSVPMTSKPTSERLQERAVEAGEKLNKEYNAIVDKAAQKHSIPMQDLVGVIEDTIKDYTSKGARLGKKTEVYENLAEELYNDLFHIKLGPQPFVKGMPAIPPQVLVGGMDVRKVADWKSGLQKEATYGRDALVKETPEIEKFFSDLSFKVNTLLADTIPDKRLRDIGLKQHDLLTVRGDLSKKIARQKATGLVNPPSLLQGRQGSFYAQKFLESLPMGSTDEGLLLRAGAQEMGGALQNKLPEAVDFVRQGLEAVPEAMGKMVQPQNQGRQPQSVPNVPEMLLKVKIPRTTEGVIANKNVVLAKVSQQDPTFYPILKEFIEDRPDELGDLLPKLIASTPTAFERDPYNRVDNKVQDQASKLKAINDTMRREDLTNTEKISIVNNLNKTGEFLDYEGGSHANN